MGKNYSKQIIVLLVIINFFTLFKLYSLEKTFNRELYYYKNDVNNLRNDINNIYNNVDEKLKKQASIIDSFNITLGNNLNSDNLTVPFEFAITPKENSDDLIVSILINEEKIIMKKSNSTYTATYDANIFDDLELKVVLEKNGEEKIEIIV